MQFKGMRKVVLSPVSLDLGVCYTNCIDCSQHLVVSMVAYETSHTNCKHCNACYTSAQCS